MDAQALKIEALCSQVEKLELKLEAICKHYGISLDYQPHSYDVSNAEDHGDGVSVSG